MDIGWKKLRVGKIDKMYGENVASLKNRDSLFYLSNVKGISPEEINLILTVVSSFREHNDDFESFNQKIIDELIDEYCESKHLYIEDKHKNRLLEEIKREVKGLSVLDVLLQDKDLEEIAVLGAQKPILVYHKKYGWLQTDLVISNDKKIIDIVNRISRNIGRRITLQKPRINAHLPFGRMHAAIPPLSDAACITIRKFNEIPFSPSDLIRNKTISSEGMTFLWLAVQSNVNILVVGGTGCGKTSTLNSIFSFIPLNERVVVVEETPELNLPHEHQIRLTTSENLKVNMHELVLDTLRMRPDRVVVGEVRSPEEAKALMDTMLAGQGKSSFATFHAQNGQEALIRLQSLGINAIDLHAIDLIVVQKRWTQHQNKKAVDIRRITEISALKKDYAGTPEIVPIFLYNNTKDKLVSKNLTNNIVSEKICFAFNFKKSQFERELSDRAKFLEKQRYDFNEFTKAVNAL